VCQERLSITRLHCRNCDTTIDGHFDLGRWGRVTNEQLEFLEMFIRCEGKFSRMEKEMGLSYPTLRSRLGEIIRQMGFSVGPEEAPPGDEERRSILDRLGRGEITSKEAMSLLEGG
jgi:hypothetical protein